MKISLPSLLNVGALTLLVLFIYSTLGVFLFSNVMIGERITNYTNFWNFHNAMITLFRSATGEDWWRIMFDVGHTSDCVPNVSCGSCNYKYLKNKSFCRTIFFYIYYADNFSNAKFIYIDYFK